MLLPKTFRRDPPVSSSTGLRTFEAMRKAGRLTAEALDLLVPLVKPGVTTDELDRVIVEFARDHKAVPAPYNYRGYPKSICTSINHVVCHGIPNDKPLREGDIVNIDVTLDRRRLAWRFEPDVQCGRGEPEGRTPGRGHLRVPHARHRRGQARRPSGRHRACHPDLCRGRALLGGSRLLRPRPGPRLSRPPQCPALRPHGRRRRTEARHVLHHRTDDQSRAGRT